MIKGAGMKIIFVITGLGVGGAERQVCSLADQFAKLGHSVLLIVMTGDIVSHPREPSIDIVLLKMTKSPLGILRAYFKARRLIAIFKPDVIHSHMIHANLFSRLLRLTTPFQRLICTAHSINEGGKMRMLAYRFTDGLCDLTTNVSQEAVDKFIDYGVAPVNRIIAMHNGIDTARFSFKESCRACIRDKLGLTDSSVLFLAVGRLTAAKDYPNLLTAFSSISEKFPHVKLAIIGAGEEEQSLLTMIKQKGLDARVHFLGLRHDVADWMSAADVFVLSSAWEGFGLVVAEAMACKRVVVATDCGGVKEVVGDAGFLVPPKDSEKLASAMSDALALSLNSRTYLGGLARKHVEDNYSLSSVCERWLRIYSGDYNVF